MGRLGSLIRKEFQQFQRDKRMRGIVIIAPVMQIIVLGYAANMDVKDVPMAVYDQDRSSESRDLVQAFVASGSFLLAAAPDSNRAVEEDLSAGKAEIAIIVPPGFGADLRGSGTPSLQMLVDGSRSNTAAVGLAYASSVANNFALRFAPGSVRIALPMEARTRVWYNPELKSRVFMIPGVFALLLMVITIILTSLAIVKEKESGTLEQLIVTPLRKAELIAGKLAPFVIISLVLICFALAACALFFGIVPRGSIFLLFLLSLALVFSTLGIGLLVSTFARTQQQAMMFSIFFFMFPMMILSGFVFPIANMPAPIRAVTYLMPLRYYMIIVRGIFLKGSGIELLWPQLWPLLVIGTAVVSFSIARFRKQLD
jgi:ABC-2 type transport system permease protein